MFISNDLSFDVTSSLAPKTPSQGEFFKHVNSTFAILNLGAWFDEGGCPLTGMSITLGPTHSSSTQSRIIKIPDAQFREVCSHICFGCTRFVSVPSRLRENSFHSPNYVIILASFPISFQQPSYLLPDLKPDTIYMIEILVTNRVASTTNEFTFRTSVARTSIRTEIPRNYDENPYANFEANKFRSSVNNDLSTAQTSIVAFLIVLAILVVFSILALVLWKKKWFLQKTKSFRLNFSGSYFKISF